MKNAFQLPTMTEVNILEFLSSGRKSRTEICYAVSSTRAASRSEDILEALSRRGLLLVFKNPIRGEPLFNGIKYYEVSDHGRNLLRAWEEAVPSLVKVDRIYRGLVR